MNRNLKEFKSPQWAFIDLLPGAITTERKYRLGFKQDLISGLVGGAAFNLLLFAIRIFNRAFIPEVIRNTPEFILQFQNLIAAMNIIIGIIVMLAVTVRSKQFGEIHGLFGVYIAGLVSSIGHLVQNLLFGGGIDMYLTLYIITTFVVYGAVASFPIGVLISVVRERRNRRIASTIQ